MWVLQSISVMGSPGHRDHTKKIWHIFGINIRETSNKTYKQWYTNSSKGDNGKKGTSTTCFVLNRRPLYLHSKEELSLRRVLMPSISIQRVKKIIPLKSKCSSLLNPNEQAGQDSAFKWSSATPDSSDEGHFQARRSKHTMGVPGGLRTSHRCRKKPLHFHRLNLIGFNNPTLLVAGIVNGLKYINSLFRMTFGQHYLHP